MGAFCVALYGVSRVSPLAAYIALGGTLLLYLVIGVWLPRAGHAAFVAGHYSRAGWLYRVLRTMTPSRRAKAAVDVSLAGCDLARERYDDALARLEQTSQPHLEGAAHAVWFNNRAYALARSGRDPHAALQASEQALGLRPDVAGFRHTRGLALLGMGRIEDAISELDRLWSDLVQRNPHPLLEAERCYDLGIAWTKKGEHEYAQDYFERALRAAPESSWAQRAGANLNVGGSRAQSFNEYV